MNINEVIRNPWLVVPANISKFGESNELEHEVACFVEVVNRDSNQDGSRPITINVNNSIHIHLPASGADVQPDMTINNERGYDDNGDDDDEEEADDISDGDSGSSGSSQQSIAYTTPPSSGQPSQPKLSPEP